MTLGPGDGKAQETAGAGRRTGGVAMTVPVGTGPGAVAVMVMVAVGVDPGGVVGTVLQHGGGVGRSLESAKAAVASPPATARIPSVRAPVAQTLRLPL